MEVVSGGGIWRWYLGEVVSRLRVVSGEVVFGEVVSGGGGI